MSEHQRLIPSIMQLGTWSLATRMAAHMLVFYLHNHLRFCGYSEARFHARYTFVWSILAVSGIPAPGLSGLVFYTVTPATLRGNTRLMI